MAGKRDFQRRFFEDNDSEEEEESEYVEQEEEEDVSDSTGSEPEYDTNKDVQKPLNPIPKAVKPAKRIYSDPGASLERSGSSSPRIVETKEEDEEEKIRMMVMMQRKEAQQKRGDMTGKRREALKRRERERDEEIAKAIAQAKKEHTQQGVNSNRSSVQSSSVEGDLSTFPNNEKRPSYDSEKDLLMERERLASEREAREEQARQALKQERERLEKEQREKEQQDKERLEHSHESNGTHEVSEDAKRAEILAQRQAKLAKRKSRDVVAADKNALNHELAKEGQKEKDHEGKKSKHKEDKDKDEKKEKKKDKDKEDDDKKEKKKSKEKGEDKKEGEEATGGAAPEIGRRVSKKEKSAKRDRSKRFQTLPGVLLLDADISSPSPTELKSTSRSNPSSPKELVVPKLDSPKVTSPSKGDAPTSPKSSGTITDPAAFREKIREQFLGATSRQGSFHKDNNELPAAEQTQSPIVLSAIDTQRFRKPPKLSDDPEEKQKKTILSIISMFETTTKNSDLKNLDHRRKTSSTSLDEQKRKISNTSLDLDESAASHPPVEGGGESSTSSKWEILKNNLGARGTTNAEGLPPKPTWRKEAFEQPPTKVAPPVIKPMGGTFTTPVTVEITCVTPGVNIFYSTSGSFPSKLSPQYDPEVPLVLTADTNLRVIAIYKNNLLESRVITAHFIVQPSSSAPPPS